MGGRQLPPSARTTRVVRGVEEHLQPGLLAVCRRRNLGVAGLLARHSQPSPSSAWRRRPDPHLPNVPPARRSRSAPASPRANMRYGGWILDRTRSGRHRPLCRRCWRETPDAHGRFARLAGDGAVEHVGPSRAAWWAALARGVAYVTATGARGENPLHGGQSSWSLGVRHPRPPSVGRLGRAGRWRRAWRRWPRLVPVLDDAADAAMVVAAGGARGRPVVWRARRPSDPCAFGRRLVEPGQFEVDERAAVHAARSTAVANGKDFSEIAGTKGDRRSGPNEPQAIPFRGGVHAMPRRRAPRRCKDADRLARLYALRGDARPARKAADCLRSPRSTPLQNRPVRLGAAVFAWQGVRWRAQSIRDAPGGSRKRTWGRSLRKGGGWW